MADCKEKIYKKDTYRRTGRGKSGFEMHYNRAQCSRRAQEGRDYCWQHPYSEYRGKALAAYMDIPRG